MPASQSLKSSLLDRLLDYNPGVEKDPPISPAQAMRELHHSVRRDLETLLNTRCRFTEIPPGLPELEQSLVNYGIPDFTGANLASPASREQFRRVIEARQRVFCLYSRQRRDADLRLPYGNHPPPPAGR